MSVPTYLQRARDHVQLLEVEHTRSKGAERERILGKLRQARLHRQQCELIAKADEHLRTYGTPFAK